MLSVLDYYTGSIKKVDSTLAFCRVLLYILHLCIYFFIAIRYEIPSCIFAIANSQIRSDLKIHVEITTFFHRWELFVKLLSTEY